MDGVSWTKKISKTKCREVHVAIYLSQCPKLKQGYGVHVCEREWLLLSKAHLLRPWRVMGETQGSVGHVPHPAHLTPERHMRQLPRGQAFDKWVWIHPLPFIGCVNSGCVSSSICHSLSFVTQKVCVCGVIIMLLFFWFKSAHFPRTSDVKRNICSRSKNYQIGNRTKQFEERS